MANKWILCFPIYNLKISEELKGEYQIEQVRFVSADKISRIRNKIGFKSPISSYVKKQKWMKIFNYKFFSKAETYAIIKTNNDGLVSLDREFKQIEDSVFILASSQFFRVDRRRRYFFGNPYTDATLNLQDEILCYDIQKDLFESKGIHFPTCEYLLDNKWAKYIKNHFFPYLIKILNKDFGAINENWKFSIRNAAILAGKSQLTHKIHDSFLYNMIAIESLLSSKIDDIIDNVVGMFGWMTNNETEYWAKLMDGLYKKRCKYVHTGEYKDINSDDLANSDQILFNILYNICRLTKVIKSQSDIINLSKSVSAMKLLNVKIKRALHLKFVRGKKISSPSRHWME